MFNVVINQSIVFVFFWYTTLMKQIISFCILLIFIGCNAVTHKNKLVPLSAQSDYRRVMVKVSPLLLAGNYYQAQRLLKNTQGFLRGSKFFYNTQYWLGECSVGQGDYIGAQKYYYSAYKGLDNGLTKILSVDALARAYYFNGQYQQALAYFTIVYKQYFSKVNGQKLLFLMADAYKQTGNLPKYRLCLNQLKYKFPNNTFDTKVVKTEYHLTKSSVKDLKTDKYYLQCGIFSDAKNATALIAKLKWNGFSPFLIKKPTGKVYVILGYYSSKQRAKLESKQLKRFGFDSVVKQ